MSNEYVTVSKISVDVCRNDPVDVRAGGPEWLGFDFFVDDRLSDEMIKFIQISLAHLNIPIASINEIDKSVVNKSDVWDKERILESLNEQADYLRHEAARNYPAPSARRKTN